MSKIQRLGRKETIGLYCIFFLGAATIIASCARFILSVKSIFSYGTYVIGVVEVATQLFVVALPALRPLVSKLKSGSHFAALFKKFPSISSSAVSRSRNTGQASASTTSVTGLESSAAHVEDGDYVPLGNMEIYGSDTVEGESGPIRATQPWEAIELPQYMR